MAQAYRMQHVSRMAFTSTVQFICWYCRPAPIYPFTISQRLHPTLGRKRLIIHSLYPRSYRLVAYFYVLNQAFKRTTKRTEANEIDSPGDEVETPLLPNAQDIQAI